jgi:hypothetical protein
MELVAVKIINVSDDQALDKNTERELINHRRLLHPNIIRFKVGGGGGCQHRGHQGGH